MLAPRHLSALFLLTTSLSSAATPVAYEIRPRSVMNSTCCELGAPQPIDGSFLLTEEDFGPAGILYRLSEVRIETGRFTGYTGSGSYRRNPVDPQTEMVLDLERGDGGSTRFTGTGESSGISRWPVIRIWVSSGGEFSQILYLIAVPRSEFIRCQLGPGSQLAVQYDIATIRRGSHPLAGTFLVNKIFENAEVSLYRMDTIDFRTSGETVDWAFTGEGLLAIDRRMEKQKADLVLTGTRGLFRSLVLSGEETLPGPQVPRIESRLADEGGGFSLHLIGAPVTSDPFLRGDPNADGAIDLSDAVGILARLFQGGPAPLCQEAADVNLDRRHDPADAIALLQYLFLDGAPPPFPGTQWCGLPQELAFGCEGYQSCPKVWIWW